MSRDENGTEIGTWPFYHSKFRFLKPGQLFLGSLYLVRAQSPKNIKQKNPAYGALLLFEGIEGTEDGSVNSVPQILYGQYFILGAFGSYML